MCFLTELNVGRSLIMIGARIEPKMPVKFPMAVMACWGKDSIQNNAAGCNRTLVSFSTTSILDSIMRFILKIFRTKSVYNFVRQN